MSSEEKSKEHKQSTQAIAQQPQEEFISPTNLPSKTEEDAESSPPAKDHEPPKQ